MHFLEDVPLAPYTTFGVGGPARWFAEAATEDNIVEAVEFAESRELPLFVLGGGSNLLVSDEGFPGLVVHVALHGIDRNAGSFSVAAGEDWDRFVTLAVEAGCGGIECLAGIPGSVGGTPVQNVGAYGQEVSETIAMIRAFDLTRRAFVDLLPECAGFGYRRSIFNTTKQGRYIVTRVDYNLRSAAETRLSYPDLKLYFEGKPHPSLAEISAAVRSIRKAKGMLLVPGDPDCASAGSFFKNPIVDDAVRERLAGSGFNVPQFGVGANQWKIPAAWLVEQAGFPKGYRFGRAGISSKHTLALINRGGASALEIANLRDRIVEAVERKFGIRLEPEPVWVAPTPSMRTARPIPI